MAFKLNSTSNDAFKNTTNPITKVRLNEENRCISWMKQNTFIKTSFSLSWIWKTYLRLRASEGLGESSTAAQITVGLHCQDSWQFSVTLQGLQEEFYPPRRTSLRQSQSPLKLTFHLMQSMTQPQAKRTKNM